ncbi:MAG: ABC transporter ATP-binding protein [Gammaproteobacteria bacterium]|nr:ABC transporter ATP-binding protein [Gammaproteobacteria bacterium]
MDENFRPLDASLRRKLRDIVRIVPRVYGFLWQVTPGYFMISCAIMVVTALIPAAIIYMTKVIVDGVVEAASGGGHWTDLVTPVAVIFGLWLVETLLGTVSNMVQSMLSERVQFAARERIVEKAGSLDIAFYENPKFYDQLRHAQDQLYQVTGIVWSSIGLVRSGVGITAMAGLLTILHPFAIVVLFVTVLPSLLMQGFFARLWFDFDTQWVRNYRMLDYLQRLLTSRDSAKEVRIFTLKDALVARFRRFRETQLRAYLRMQFRSMRVRTGLDIVSLAGVASIWAYAVYQAALARITVGDLTLVFNAAQQARSQLNALVGSGGQVYEQALFATRFFDLLDMDPASVEAALAPPPPNPAPTPIRLTQGIEFRNVSFKYPGTDKWILRGVSFDVPARSKVAIVGENGAGKTTLVKLLARLYDPVEGEVLFDGRDLREYDLGDVRRDVAVVFQDYFRYELSAADNVGFGEVRALDDRDRIQAAAKQAGAHDIIEALPKGYDTVLGRTFDEGVDLSGGEWQHLAISRAFLSDAQILILDEPTAALDAFREHRLYEQVAELSANKTVVFISHRFSTVRMADLIVVVEDGEITELGDHETLLEHNGKYAAMFNTQAARYR